MDNITFLPGQTVHVHCRKDYCNPIRIKLSLNKKPTQTVLSPSLRSNTERFNFSTNCLFCAQRAKFVGRKRGYNVYPVRTVEFKNNIEKICIDRDDKQGSDVKSRLETIHDLPAADATSHQSCSVNFRTSKNIPQVGNEKGKKCGRPVNMAQEFAFQEIAKFLIENDDEQITLKDLVDKMVELCGELSYTSTHMKKRLLEHFGSSIVITELNGKQNVITFRNTASSILHSFYQKSSSDSDAYKIEIIKTAAQLLLTDIKDFKATKLPHPDYADLMSTQANIDYIPDSLKTFFR